MDLEHVELTEHDKQEGEEEGHGQLEDNDDNDNDDDDEEEESPTGGVLVKKGGRKKTWRDYQRYDFNKTEGRKRLRAAEDALQQSHDGLEAAQQALQAAQALHAERLAHHKTVSEQVVDELLESEAPRPWNKMYQRLLLFYVKHGHCLMSVRASTAKRKLDKEKELRKMAKKNMKLAAVENDDDPTITITTTTTKDNEPAVNEPAVDCDKEPSQDSKDLENTQEQQQQQPQDTNFSSEDEEEEEDVMDADEIGALGRWAAMQRTHKKKGKLEDWKVAALERLAFVWDARDISWHTSYQELKDFHQEHGHIRVLPVHNKSLNRWIRFQRDNYRDFQANGFVEREDVVGMNSQRMELLEALGMDWRSHDERWIVLFHKLQQLACTQGHLRTIPEKQIKLIQFVDKQRRAYKEFMKDGGYDSKDMTNERVLLLESINFPWTTEDDADNQDSMKKMTPGTPIVTSNLLTAAKKNYPNQTNDKTGDDWMKYYGKVKSFYNVYQHFHYAAAHVDLPRSEIALLQQWDAVQRQHYQELMNAKKNKKAAGASPLTPERAELLHALGFLQPNHNRDWDYQIAQLRRFHNEQGHAKVLLAEDYPNNPQWRLLADWAVIQREEYRKYQSNERSTLTWDRVYELKTLGFNWTLTENENESTLEAAQPDTGGTEQSRAIPPPVTMVQRTSLPTLHRKRGRPRKYPIKPPVQAWVLFTQPIDEQRTKRGRGRPRKSDEEKKRDKEAREAAKAHHAVGEASPIVALNAVGEVSLKLAVATAVDLTADKGAEEKKTQPEEQSELATMLL
jgi:Helicase associated domain/AT hook motif